MNKEKKIGFWSIVLLTINSIIGSGIFLSPGSVIKVSGSYAPLVYLLAAGFATILAITFASAAKYVNKGGAAYVYTKAAFGENVGFYVGITRFIAASIAWGVMATAVVRTTLSIFYLDSDNFTYITIGFLVLMFILLAINLVGTKLLTFVNDLSTIGKLLALVITIVAGGIVLFLSKENHFNEINLISDASGSPLILPMTSSTFVMSVITAFYAFTGFESVASGAMDMEEPEKNLPKAIPLGIAVIAIIYCLIVLISMMINPEALVSSNQIVVLSSIFENKIISNLIVYGALVSMFGINVAASFHTPRVLEAMATERQIPKVFNKRTKTGFPIVAFALTSLIAVIIPITFNYDMGSIIVISSVSRFVQFIFVPIAVVTFYKGSSKEKIIDANKNFFTDVICPIISIGLTIFLLIKFDWTQQFSIIDPSGVSHANIGAIFSMITGYLVIPAILYVYMNRYLKQSEENKTK